MTRYPAPGYEMEAEAWWVQQWVDLLNSYRFKKRLERGRKYAREGHILCLEFKGSKVVADVQGTATEPYKLSIWIDQFTDEDWDYIVDTMAQQAIYSAQLLAGEMPPNIEEIFTANGLSLFPFTLSDVHSRCNCPDPKNPCKHIAAVYYQLGDFFREDPFVLFQLRGRTKAQLLDALRQKRRLQNEGQTDEISIQSEDQDSTLSPTSPQTALELENFWQYNHPLDSSLVVITPSDSIVLDVLGSIPLPAKDAQAVMGCLREIYQTVGREAMVSALS